MKDIFCIYFKLIEYSFNLIFDIVRQIFEILSLFIFGSNIYKIKRIFSNHAIFCIYPLLNLYEFKSKKNIYLQSIKLFGTDVDRKVQSHPFFAIDFKVDINVINCYRFIFEFWYLMQIYVNFTLLQLLYRRSILNCLS